MADDLEAFYAEIANVEAEVGAKEENPPSDQHNKNSNNAPALPPPPRPPPASVNQQQEIPPPPTTHRPPITSPPQITISQAPVIAAPPQPAQQDPPSHLPTPSTQPPPPSTHQQQKPPPPPTKNVAYLREAAGQRWVDPTLGEWPDNDFRIFVGNLGPEVSDAMLSHSFNRYESFQKAKVIKEARSGKSKGYGFVSLGDPREGARALREMQGQYVGHRPCQLKKGKVDERSVLDKKGKPKKRVLQPAGDVGKSSKSTVEGYAEPAKKHMKSHEHTGSILHR